MIRVVDHAGERALIACAIAAPSTTIALARHEVEPEVFGEALHRQVWDAVLAAYDGGALSAVDVLRALKRPGVPEGVTASAIEIAGEDVDASTWPAIFEGLTETRKLRETRGLAQSIAEAGAKSGADELLDHLAEESERIRSIRTAGDPLATGPEVEEWTTPDPEELARYMIPTGLGSLDRILGGGIWKDDYVILAARSSNGKTAFTLKLAREAAAAGKKVAVISLETPPVDLMIRMAAAMTGVDSRRARRGQISPHEAQKIHDARDRIVSEGMIQLSEARGCTAAQICARIRQACRRGLGYDLILIDYAQLIVGDSSEDVKADRYNKASEKLLAVAKDCGVAIVLCTQVTDESGDRGGKSKSGRRPVPPVPNAGNVRYGKEMEHHADVCLVLHYPRKYDTRMDSRVLVRVDKARNGEPGEMWAEFDAPRMEFVDDGEGAPRPPQEETDSW